MSFNLVLTSTAVSATNTALKDFTWLYDFSQVADGDYEVSFVFNSGNATANMGYSPSFNLGTNLFSFPASLTASNINMTGIATGGTTSTSYGISTVTGSASGNIISCNKTLCCIKKSRNDITLKEYDSTLQSNWYMPDEYKNMDIEEYVYSKCLTQIATVRVTQEMAEYKSRPKLNTNIIRCNYTIFYWRSHYFKLGKL